MMTVRTSLRSAHVPPDLDSTRSSRVLRISNRLLFGNRLWDQQSESERRVRRPRARVRMECLLKRDGRALERKGPDDRGRSDPGDPEIRQRARCGHHPGYDRGQVLVAGESAYVDVAVREDAEDTMGNRSDPPLVR